jgi:hypothetical protein
MLYSEPLNALYLHLPKCGGNTVKDIIQKYYNFIHLPFRTNTNHADFVEDVAHFENDRDVYCHSIRTKGKYRYFMSHPSIDIEKIQKAYKFTFVRNPYEKILSAYMYLKKKLQTHINFSTTLHKSPENPEFFKEFPIFVKNYTQVNNVCYSHAFIRQYDQLCDFSGNITFDFIGKTENLMADLFLALSHLDIIKFPHLNQIEKKHNTSDYDKPIYEYYDEETFLFVNDFFKIDFDTFGYTRFDTFLEFNEYYRCKDSPKIPKLLFRDEILQEYQITTHINKIHGQNPKYTTITMSANDATFNDDAQVIYAFKNATIHKPMFIRCMHLYRNGGIYMDLDVDPKIPLDQLIRPNDEYVFYMNSHSKTIKKCFIAVAPKHPVIKRMIEQLTSCIIQDKSVNENNMLSDIVYEYIANMPIQKGQIISTK